MRQARIKLDSSAEEAVYHCMTRTVNGELLFDDVAKEVLRKQMWQVADYCGLEILTYALMSNHFHVLVRVPQAGELTDVELLRRFAVLYPKPTRYQTARLEVVKNQLKNDGEEAVAWRRRQRVLMGDVSAFMKLVKQRFSIWYNKSHQRFGTLWAERFKSVLVESDGRVLQTMAAYIDLNPVRAGLVSDPKDYRFCGYADAVAGNATAQSGLVRVSESANWSQAQSDYRQTLFGTGAGAREHAQSISKEQFDQVVKSRGRLPLATVLRLRIRYFSDGAALGSQAFIQKHRLRLSGGSKPPSRAEPRPLPQITDWGGLATLRPLRNDAFG